MPVPFLLIYSAFKSNLMFFFVHFMILWFFVHVLCANFSFETKNFWKKFWFNFFFFFCWKILNLKLIWLSDIIVRQSLCKLVIWCKRKIIDFLLPRINLRRARWNDCLSTQIFNSFHSGKKDKFWCDIWEIKFSVVSRIYCFSINNSFWCF